LEAEKEERDAEEGPVKLRTWGIPHWDKGWARHHGTPGNILKKSYQGLHQSLKVICGGKEEGHIKPNETERRRIEKAPQL